jgi:hypothetical protein
MKGLAMRTMLLSVLFLLTLITTVCFSSQVTKTVGVGQDYTTIADALADINANGLADTVNLALMDTIYNESPLLYIPSTSQPQSLYIAQGGSAKPVVNISGGGFLNAFFINNREEVVLYNVIIKPSTSDTWTNGVYVRSSENNSRVYIQSGGVIGSTTQRGYDVLADSSAEVNIFGCLVLQVQSVGINITFQDFPSNMPKQDVRHLLGSSGQTLTISDCSISGADTGVSVNGIAKVLTMNDNIIAQCDVGTAINSMAEMAEIRIHGNSDSVGYRGIYLPNAHNLSLFEVGASGSFSKTHRSRIASTVKFAYENQQKNVSYIPDEIGVDITINNDPGVVCQLNIENVDFDWTQTAIRIDGNFDGIERYNGNTFDMSNLSGYSAMQYRAKRAEVSPNIDGIKTAELRNNTITGPETGISWLVGNDPSGGSLQMTGNSLSDVTTGFDIEFDNDSAGFGGVSLDSVIFPPVNLQLNGILAAIAIPNFVAMQYRAKRAELPSNCSAISIVSNTVEADISGGMQGSFLSIPDSNFNINTLEINNNTATITGGGSFFIDSFFDVTTELSIEGNNFQVNSFFDVFFDITITDGAMGSMNNNSFQQGSPSFAMKSGNNISSLAGRRYELQVRKSDKVMLSKTLLGMSSSAGEWFTYQNNTVSNFEEVIISVDDSSGLPGSITMTGNMFDGGTGALNKNLQSLAGRRYELQVRKSDKVMLSKRIAPFSLGSAEWFTYNNDTVMNFTDVVITIDDSSETPASVTITGNLYTENMNDTILCSGVNVEFSNNVFTGPPTGFIQQSGSNIQNHYSSMGGSSTQLKYNTGRPPRRFSNVSKSETGTDTLKFIIRNNTFQNPLALFIDGVVDSEYIDPVKMVVEENIFDNSAAASSSIQIRFNTGKPRGTYALSSGKTTAVFSPDLLALNDNVFMETNVTIADTGSNIELTNNTFTNSATVSSKAGTSSLAARRYELQVRKSDKVMLSSTWGKQSAVAGEDLYVYLANNIFNVPLSDVVIDVEDVMLQMEGNTANGGATVASKQSSSLPANKYEVSIRRGAKINGIVPKTSPVGVMNHFIVDSFFDVYISENTFTGFSGAGLLLAIAQDSLRDTTNVFLGDNSFSNNTGNGLEITGDTGVIIVSFQENEFSSNSGNGLHTLRATNSDWGVTYFGWQEIGTTRVQNNGGNGIHVEGNIEVGSMRYSNISGNIGYNLFNGTPHDIDARYNFWGLSDSELIGEKLYDGIDSAGLGILMFMPFEDDTLSNVIATIQGVVYYDSNKSFSKDVDEAGITGCEILLMLNGETVNTTTTTGGGEYEFTDVVLYENETYLVVPNCGSSYTENADGKVFQVSTPGTYTANFGVYVDPNLYRTASMQSWATATDKKGKVKAEKCKPDKVDFKFTLTSPESSSAVSIKFSMLTSGVLTVGTEKAETLAAWNNSKEASYSGAMSAGSILQVDGRGVKGKQVKTKVAWTKATDGKKTKQTVESYILNNPRLPMPNLQNVGMDLELQGALPMTVGNSSDAKSIIFNKYKDVQKSLNDGRGGLHTGDAACLSDAKLFKKQMKGLSPKKKSNKFFAEALTLKLNLISSENQKFPGGLGSLQYAGGGKYHGWSVDSISQFGDKLLACDSVSMLYDPSLDISDVMVAIDTAFDGEIDTVAWSCGKLELTGVRQLSDVSYLRVGPNSIEPRTGPSPITGRYVPDQFELGQNYPNPFNPTTTIQFNLMNPSLVTLKIYSVLGQEVAKLYENELFDEGEFETEFDASHLSSGVYFYRLTANEIADEEFEFTPETRVQTMKMMIIK